MATKPPQAIEGTPLKEGETISAEQFAEQVENVIDDIPSSSTPRPSSDSSGGTSSQPTVVADTPPVSAPSTVPPPVRPNRPETAVSPEKGAPFMIQSNRNILRHLRMLVYSEYGGGKTLLIGTAVGVPEMRDVLMVSAELGELTLFSPEEFSGETDAYTGIPFELIDIVQVNDYKTTSRVHEFLKLHCTARDLAADGNPKAIQYLMDLQAKLMPGIPDPERLRLYRTVLIDTITEVEVYCMQQLLGITDDTMIEEEINSPEWAEYNRQRQMIHRLIRNFRNLPMNVLYACQRQFKENEQKRRIYGPQMTGKLSSEVQGFMDVVGHLIVGDTTADDPIPPRRMLIQPGPRHAAKNRFRRYKLPHWDNPTIPMIVRDVGLQDVWAKYGTYLSVKQDS